MKNRLLQFLDTEKTDAGKKQEKQINAEWKAWKRMEIFTVKQDVSIEYTEKKSLFIGHAFFVTEESEAMAAIASVKKQHAEATHNVWAYSLRKFSAQRFSDDGEPQGTAGMPVLSAIK